MNKERIKWYLKQLLPLRYESKLHSVTENEYHHTIWNMWFGKCFNIKRMRME